MQTKDTINNVHDPIDEQIKNLGFEIDKIGNNYTRYVKYIMYSDFPIPIYTHYVCVVAKGFVQSYDGNGDCVGMTLDEMRVFTKKLEQMANDRYRKKQN